MAVEMFELADGRLLENEIAPMFYERRENSAGSEWLRRIKQSLMYLSPQFDCRRMVMEYMTQLYEPAHTAFTALSQSNFEPAREKALWNARVSGVWDKVRIVETSPAPTGAVTSGGGKGMSRGPRRSRAASLPGRSGCRAP